MKKWLKWVSLLTAALMLIGCLPLTATAEEQVTLTLWSIWSSDSESNKAPFLKTIEEFEAAYPNIKVELDMSEAEAYRTKIKTAVAANEAPDVFYYNAGGLLKSFVDAGKVLALDDYLDDATRSRIVEGTLANMTFDGKVYGLPYTLACSVLYCNTDLFDQYGVKIPETWGELMTAVKTFKDAGLVPMALGGKDRWPTCMYTDLITLRAAGYQESYDAFYKTENGSFVSDGMKLAAEKYNELIEAGAFPVDAVALTRDESEVPFYNGEIPMYVNGNWTAANCSASPAVSGKIKAVAFPTIEGGKGQITDFMGGAAEEFCVSANTAHPQEAYTLCQFLAENHSKNAYLAGAGMPTWKLDSSVDTSNVDPLIQSIVDLTNHASCFLLWGNTALEGEDSEFLMDTVLELLARDIDVDTYCEKLQTIITGE
ncbi:MAG: extracellular solute-binding protein [Eubacteriales bacterium]|nr:extracellular solute-binding protein [Eubacteriales bacterium]